MERLYTLSTFTLSLRDSPNRLKGKVGIRHRAVLTNIKEGRLSAHARQFGERWIWAVGVRDVQTFLAVTIRATSPEWLLRTLLDFAAATIISGGGRAAANQRHLDKESGYGEEQRQVAP